MSVGSPLAPAALRWAWLSFDELDGPALYAALALRQAVFVVEQDCPYLDADGLDDRSMHLLGWRGGDLAAYARALPPGLVYPCAAIGRVVTSPAARGQGLGRPLMRRAMAHTWRRWGPGPIKLSAQAHLEPYYRSLGFAVCGPGYDEDGIPHLPMRCAGPPGNIPAE